MPLTIDTSTASGLPLMKAPKPLWDGSSKEISALDFSPTLRFIGSTFECITSKISVV